MYGQGQRISRQRLYKLTWHNLMIIIAFDLVLILVFNPRAHEKDNRSLFYQSWPQNMRLCSFWFALSHGTFNWLWSNGATIWRYKSEWPLASVIACCLIDNVTFPRDNDILKSCNIGARIERVLWLASPCRISHVHIKKICISGFIIHSYLICWIV